MEVTRRAFAAGVGSAAAAIAAFPVRAQQLAPGAAVPPALAPAVAAIWAYAEQHRQFMNLPALTVGLAVPGAPAITRNFGFAELGARTPLSGQTLFQIGSISKLLAAALVHQLAAEGRFALTDPISGLMPDLPLPRREPITVQQLLDHVSGLPSDAPLFPPGGLWTGFKPGTRWHYSNTGYDILGKLIEHKGGASLARQLHDRVFAPLGMIDSKGAIIAEDRTRTAQGYEAAANAGPFVRGAALAPAGFVDVTFAAGSTVSTAADMVLLMRSIASAARGKGGLGHAPAAALELTRHAVPTDVPTRRYGNGFMHDTVGGRTLLHHTGGMVSFSSAFHLDPVSGAGAFASSSLTGLAGYRPRLLTLFAVDAINAALAGKPVPRPPALSTPLANAADYVGTFAGPSGSFTVKPGASGLVILADGREASLQHNGGDVFVTLHPRFNRATILFERAGGKAVAGAAWGSDTFVKAGSAWKPAPGDPALARLAGRYVNDSPWWGVGMINERGGKLWVGTETRLTRIAGSDLWRLGDEPWSPERLRFADPIDGRPQTLYFSGEKFVRHDI